MVQYDLFHFKFYSLVFSIAFSSFLIINSRIKMQITKMKLLILLSGFFSRTITLRRTAAKGRGHLLNSSLQLSPAFTLLYLLCPKLTIKIPEQPHGLNESHW